MRGKAQPQQQPRLKTLERVFSKAGMGSRSDARSWIGTGQVRVNGQVVQNPDHWVDLDRDTITFQGKPLRMAERIYILLYKPKGYITSYGDPENRPTVYDLTTFWRKIRFPARTATGPWC
jgi:23S rRNA pseudouridine2605 synthase